MDNDIITQLHNKGILSHLDIHFAGMMEKLDRRGEPLIFFTSAIASSYTRLGQVCIDIGEMAGKKLPATEEGGDDVCCPDSDTWMNALIQSPIVGKPGDYKPLILDIHNRLLYLHRYFHYQEIVVRFIASGCSHTAAADYHPTREMLNRLFPEDKDTQDINWQKIAAITACLKKICIISGGPGTGKTTTIARIIALVIARAESHPFKIALLAPTGKAAMRLRESIQNAVKKIDCPDPVKQMIPYETATIHRFLGTIPGSPHFKHHEKNPLNVDMVIVDESSMVDLALAAKLMQALPAHAGLILLGDKDQLASVEAGAVFGDLCSSGLSASFSKNVTDVISALAPRCAAKLSISKKSTCLSDCIVHLQKSYRFDKKSGISAISRAVNQGDGDQAMQIFGAGDYPDIAWCDLPNRKNLADKLKKLIQQEYNHYLASQDPHTALKRFDGFRILCALREGPYGVKMVNMMVENLLKEQNPLNAAMEWYPLRPIMMTGNNYQLHLFNGDIGIAFPDPEDKNRLKVYFSDIDGRLSVFYPDGLSEHESVYAMTVHKSQGSEFDKTVLILPDQDSPILTRELIYTGLTRTRQKITVWGRKDVFLKAVSKNIRRTSGLKKALADL